MKTRRPLAFSLLSLALLGPLAPASTGQAAVATDPPDARAPVPRWPRFESPPPVPFARPAGPDEELLGGPRGHTRVEPATGELVHCQVDLFVPGRGLDFVFARTYRSRNGPDTALGTRWDFSYCLWIQARAGGVLLHEGSGRADLYRPDANGTYTALEFRREGVFLPDGRFELRFEDDGRWIFHPLDGSAQAGRVESIVDRNGNAMEFEYDAAGRLVLVRDTLERVYQLEYSAEGRLTALVDFVGRRVAYTHYQDGDPNGAEGDLESVTTPAVVDAPGFPLPPGHEFESGKTTTYAYAHGTGDPRLDHQLLAIVDPKGQTALEVEYDDAGRVSLRKAGEEQQEYWIITFTGIPESAHASLRVIRNDGRGTVDELFYDDRNRLRMLREYTGFADPSQPTTATENRPAGPSRPDDPAWFETRWTWNRWALPTRVVHPNGNVTRNVHEVDLDPGVAARHRADLREVHRLPGSHLPVGDQAELVEAFEYDPDHAGSDFVTRHVDARGNETLHTYDAAGNRTQTVHRDPSIVEDFEYDGFGRLTRHTRPDNGSGWRREDVTTYYAPSDGAMNGYPKQRVVDAAGLALTTTWTYDALGSVLSITDARGNETEYIVNQLRQVVLERSPEVVQGGGVRYEIETFRDANDNVVRVERENRDELGALRANTHLTTLYEYDALDRLVATRTEIEDGFERVEELVYDANDNRVLWRKGEATNGNQPDNVVRTIYDERDLVLAVVRGEGGPDHSETRYDYDGNRNPRAVHAGLGPTVAECTYDWDAYGRRVGERDPMGNTVERHYDANGNLVSERTDGERLDVEGDAGNERLSETTWTYDAMDRVVHRAAALFDENGVPLHDGTTDELFVYAFGSRLASAIDDGGQTTTFEYDTAERPSVGTDPRGNRVTLGYDAGSNVIARSELEKSDLGGPDELFTTTWSYDGLDRRVEEVDPLGRTVTWAWDSCSNRVLETDAASIETRWEYDGLDRLLRVVRDGDGDGADPLDPNDAVEARSWDDSSRLVVEVDAVGNATTHVYDGLDRRIAVQRADGTVHSSTWDVHDELVETLDANGTRITRTCDLLGRVVDVVLVPGAGVSAQTTFETFAWDGLSRLVAASDDDSSVTRTYDSLGLLLTEVQDGWTVTSTRDGMGRRTELAYPGGRTLTTARDVLGRPVALSDAGGTLMTFAWIGPQRRAQRTYANGTTTSWGYDAGRRVVATAHASPVTFPPVFDGRNHVLDALDRVVSTTETHPQGEARSYAYDALGRLVHSQRTPAVGPSILVDYVLDLVGNRSLVIGGPDAGPYTQDATLPIPADAQRNQYTTTPGASRTYDENGNLVKATAGTIETFEYDARDRLVTHFDGATSRTDTYAYDALGRRILRVLDASGSPQVTRFVHDGENVIEERDGAGVLLADLIVEENGVLPNYVRRGGVDIWLHEDIESCKITCASSATDTSGQVVERYRYSDFGRVTFLDPAGNPQPASAIGNEYLFGGRREAGLYAIGERFFDPRVGRFTTGIDDGPEAWLPGVRRDVFYMTSTQYPYELVARIRAGIAEVHEYEFCSSQRASEWQRDNDPYLSWARGGSSTPLADDRSSHYGFFHPSTGVWFLRSGPSRPDRPSSDVALDDGLWFLGSGNPLSGSGGGDCPEYALMEHGWPIRFYTYGRQAFDAEALYAGHVPADGRDAPRVRQFRPGDRSPSSGDVGFRPVLVGVWRAYFVFDTT